MLENLIDQEQESEEYYSAKEIPFLKYSSSKKDSQIDMNESIKFRRLQSDESPKLKSKQEPPRKTLASIGQHGIDIDDVFAFGVGRNSFRATKGKRLTFIFGSYLDEDEFYENIFKTIPDEYAYGMLVFSVLLNSIITPLFITIPEFMFIRNSWRFLIQAYILIPFILYEYRTGTQEIKQCYKLDQLFNQRNIRKLYVQSFNTSLQTSVFLITAQYNYIANNILIGSMVNFWLSISRVINKEKCHKIEFYGQIMCIFGVVIIACDSFLISADDLPAKYLSYQINDLFLEKPWKKIILGMGIPVNQILSSIFFCQIIVSFQQVLISIISTQISIYTNELKLIYPPFIQLFFISIFTSINLQCVGYFIYSSTIDGQHFLGWFGFIIDGAFTNFIYLAISYSLISLLLQILLRILFEPIIPACCSLLEPAFTAYFLDVFGQQIMPSSVSGLGYILVIPGQYIILFGQYQLNQKKN